MSETGYDPAHPNQLDALGRVVARIRKEQGLPEKINDPTVIAKVARILVERERVAQPFDQDDDDDGGNAA